LLREFIFLANETSFYSQVQVVLVVEFQLFLQFLRKLQFFVQFFFPQSFVSVHLILQVLENKQIQLFNLNFMHHHLVILTENSKFFSIEAEFKLICIYQSFSLFVSFQSFSVIFNFLCFVRLAKRVEHSELDFLLLQGVDREELIVQKGNFLQFFKCCDSHETTTKAITGVSKLLVEVVGNQSGVEGFQVHFKVQEALEKEEIQGKA